MTGKLYINEEAQWVDTYGVIKSHRSVIDEDVILPANSNCSSVGPIVINSGYTITISSGSNWSIN